MAESSVLIPLYPLRLNKHCTPNRKKTELVFSSSVLCKAHKHMGHGINQSV